MFVAQEKYNSNIVEYLLYMFHIEDVIRANHLSISELESKVIQQYKLPENQILLLKNWYKQLILQMTKDGVEQTGHISPLKEIIHQLNDLHIELLNSLEEEQYLEYYQFARPVINELKVKMNDPSLNEVEVCLNGLYGFMLLRMKKQEITNETLDAIAVFTQLLRFLSTKYHKNKSQQLSN
jgi:flagellin-specific chaperone FliS